MKGENIIYDPVFKNSKHFVVDLRTIAPMLPAASEILPLTRADLVSNFVNILSSQ